MDRTLKTSVERNNKGRIISTHIEVAGWRIDIDHNIKNGFGVCIANVQKDGKDAGWCACAFDPSIHDKDVKDLVLSGNERE